MTSSARTDSLLSQRFDKFRQSVSGTNPVAASVQVNFFAGDDHPAARHGFDRLRLIGLSPQACRFMLAAGPRTGLKQGRVAQTAALA
jgi:hypothetical protein